MTESITLFRPVDADELRLIEAAEMRAFPPRLPGQPIFYPVTNEAYAARIARDWNTELGSKTGFVTRFAVRRSFLDRYQRPIVGARRMPRTVRMETDKPVVNIADVPLADRGNGKQFAVKWGRAGPLLGLTGLGCAVHIVPPGKKAFPFHRHHVADELFYVVSGTGEYRYGDETFPVRSGDLVAAPAGSKAHQLINTGSADLRYLGISTMGGVDIVDYPDSGKIAMAAGVKNADFKTATYAGIGRVQAADYYDGEDR